MRFPRNTRLLALAMWVVLAALAVSGFAAFEPEETMPIPEADPAVRSEVVGLAPSAIYDFEPPALLWVDPVVPEVTATTAPPTTTTTAAPTTTTAPPTTTTTAAPTTTTAPPTTTTTAAPTTTTAPPTTTTAAPTAEDGATTTTPETTVPATTHPPAVEAWRSLVEAYFPAGMVDRALTVMWCESRGEPNATNPSSGAAGLFQHLPRYWESRSAKAGFAGANIYDPTANVGVAAYLAVTDGWKHWYPSQYCWG